MKMKSLLIFFLSLILAFSFSSTAIAACLLKMTYKDGGKKPLIGKNPDNTGAYLDLYWLAAKKIGCELKVVRLPKKRLHIELSKGKLDFYPGASFSKKRAKYLYYGENGFKTGEYGLSPLHVPTINSYGQLKTLNLRWLMEHGGSKIEVAEKLGIRTQKLPYVNIDKVRTLFRLKRSHFYVADKELIDYYPKKRGITSFKEIGLKVHKNCCGGTRPMYFGFSRFSPHFKEQPNPNFDKTKPLSPDNFPTRLVPGSIVYKFEAAIRQLKKSGKIDEIYRKHF